MMIVRAMTKADLLAVMENTTCIAPATGKIISFSEKLIDSTLTVCYDASMTLIERAMIFAARAHAGDIVGGHQVRKYSGAPYVVHLAEVAGIVKSVGGSDIQQAVAFLHDTVEDTPVTIDEIYAEFAEDFGPDVALQIQLGVTFLSDVEKHMGNRAERKAMDRDRAASAPGWVQTIKLADLISNTKDIAANDPSFAVSYLAEKALLLEVLTKGDQTLLQAARKALWESYDGLHERVQAKAAAGKAARAKTHEESVREARRLRWEKAERQLAENA